LSQSIASTHLREHGFRDVLHAREAVDDRVLAVTVALVAEAGPEAAVAEQHRGGAVAHHLGQARVEVDLEVEMRVDVQQSGHQPVAVDVDDPRGGLRRQVDAARGDTPVADRDVEGLRRPAAAIEHPGAAQQYIPGGVWHRIPR
jgi:hypothetical protein